MTVEEWVQEGIDKGYCSTISCETHSPDYLTDEEALGLQHGEEDNCIFVVRISDA